MDAGTRDLANWTRTLAHPVRLGILRVLAEQGECCVCHLTAVLRRRQPLVSQSLRVLRDSGMVLDRRDGYMVYYRLADRQVGDLLTQLASVQQALGGGPLSQLPEPPVRGCTCPECVRMVEGVVAKS